MPDRSTEAPAPGHVEAISVVQLIGLVVAVVTLIGTGLTSVVYLASIQGDIRVLQSQQTDLTKQFDKLEKSVSAARETAPARR